MGAKISKIYQNIFGRKTIWILLVGLPSAGKSTVFSKLKFKEFMTQVPTNGPLTVSVDYKNVTFSATEVAGGYRLRPILWKLFIDKVDCLMFVIDASDREAVDEVRYELHDMVETCVEKCESNECILLVVANKQDLPNCMSLNEIIDKVGLGTLKNCNWYIQAISAKEESDLDMYEGLDWLLQQL